MGRIDESLAVSQTYTGERHYLLHEMTSGRSDYLRDGLGRTGVVTPQYTE